MLKHTISKSYFAVLLLITGLLFASCEKDHTDEYDPYPGDVSICGFQGHVKRVAIIERGRVFERISKIEVLEFDREQKLLKNTLTSHQYKDSDQEPYNTITYIYSYSGHDKLGRPTAKGIKYVNNNPDFDGNIPDGEHYSYNDKKLKCTITFVAQLEYLNWKTDVDLDRYGRLEHMFLTSGTPLYDFKFGYTMGKVETEPDRMGNPLTYVVKNSDGETIIRFNIEYEYYD